jgi:polar amino acid transport system substrate-binding protein
LNPLKPLKPLQTFSPWCTILWCGVALLPFLTESGQVYAATLAEIQQQGHLTVGIKDNLPPLGYRDAAGNLQGFEVDLAKRLAKTLFKSESSLVLKPLSNVERLTAVTSGGVNMVIADVTLTENRMRVVSFSVPYYRSGTGLLSKDPQWSTLQSLYRQAVAVLIPSVTLAYLKPRLPKATLLGSANYTEAQERLDSGQVKAIAGDQIVLSALARQDSRYIFSPTQLTVQPLAIALPKGVQFDPLLQWVNHHLQDWQQQGWLETQRQHWGLP